MAWKNLLIEEDITITADEEKKHVMIELCKGGFRPNYITIQVEQRSKLDQIIQALEEARAYLP